MEELEIINKINSARPDIVWVGNTYPSWTNLITSLLSLSGSGRKTLNKKYVKDLKEAADNRVVFTGYVFGDGYKDLSQHTYIFVLPSGVDGTRPVLLDQMGFANCILARNSAANMEVLAEVGLFFDRNNLVDDLSRQLSYLINNPKQVKEYRHKAQERVKEKYSWDVATEKYIRLFRNVDPQITQINADLGNGGK